MIKIAALFVLAFHGVYGDPSAIEERIIELEKLSKLNEEQLAASSRLIASQQLTIDELESKGRHLSDATPAPPTGPAHLVASDDETRTADDIIVCLDHTWLILCGALVMFMQAGFAMLEAGTCRAKNVQSIMLKNVMDVCVGTVGWYFFGWGFAYGGPLDDDGKLENKFIGTAGFFGAGFIEANEATGVQNGGVSGSATTTQLNWFFQWAFCSAAATIVSGGVAERIMFPPYVLFSLLMTAFVYPVVVAWTWGYGFLASMNDVGFMDFAGSGVVHMTGGVGALVGAIIVGPRTGRFDPGKSEEFAPHSLPLCVLGTFILWFGWYGFNCGSTLSMHSASTGAQAAHVAMNTTVAAAAGGLVVLVLRLFITKKQTGSALYDLNGMCAGVLAGLVSVTAPCGTVECGSALFIGLIGGFIFTGASQGLKLVGVDDPIDAFPVHGACGMWGVIAAAIFDWGKGFDYASGWSGWSCVQGDDGNCLSGGWGQLFVANLVEVIVIVAWTGVLTAVILLPMRLMGVLRCDDNMQAEGLDKQKHSPTQGYAMAAQGYDV